MKLKNIIMDLPINQQELATQMIEFVNIYKSNLNEKWKKINPINKKGTKNIRQMLSGL